MLHIRRTHLETDRTTFFQNFPRCFYETRSPLFTLSANHLSKFLSLSTHLFLSLSFSLSISISIYRLFWIFSLSCLRLFSFSFFFSILSISIYILSIVPFFGERFPLNIVVCGIEETRNRTR